MLPLVNVVHVEESEVLVGQGDRGSPGRAAHRPARQPNREGDRSGPVVQDDEECLAGALGEGASLVKDKDCRALAIPVEQHRRLPPQV